jgi:hypothetical protein
MARSGQSFADYVLATPILMVGMAVAVLFAVAVLAVGARRSPVDDAVQARTEADALPLYARPAPAEAVDVSDEEAAEFSDVLALLAAHRDDVDAASFPAMPRAEALLRARRVRAS